MKRFLKQVFITAFGFLISFIFLIGLILGIVLLKSKATPSKLQKHAVLHIPLYGKIVEYKRHSLLGALEETGRKEIIELVTLKKAIQSAEKDPHIQGIYLEAGHLVGGWASLEEIRESLQAFKATGKFIIAYGEEYNNKSYYLASLADEIILHPSGNFLFTGLNLTVFFYKQLLDKLAVNPVIFRVGRYKSAVEPFMSYSMSEASKQQSSILLHTIYDHMLHQVALSRGVSVSRLKEIANDLSLLHPQGVYKASLITRIGHLDEVEAIIHSKLGLAAETSIPYIDFNKYPSGGLIGKSKRSQIAVLIASGIIEDGEGKNHNIASKGFVKILKKLRKDPQVKAIVLRINSPGGSALASETIWKELMLTKSVKPVVASMGDVAASGGYYIATACSSIFAQTTTITGSIGIYSLYFNVDTLLKDKIGITRDGVKTSPSADLFQVSRPFTMQEKFAFQKHVERGYETFLNRVAAGRQMTSSAVARLAEGRVWPGSLAKEHGLVDELGGLESAIEKAAALAGIPSNYKLSYWPKPKTYLEELAMEWQDRENSKLMNFIKAFIGLQRARSLVDLETLQELRSMQGIQARLPYKLQID